MLALLDGHPELLVFQPESRFFSWFLPQSSGLDPEQLVSLAHRTMLRNFRETDGHYKARLAPISIDETHANFENEVARIEATEELPLAPQMLRAAVFAYGEASSQVTSRTKWWVEKTPGNERHLEELTAWWPKSRLIHMVRDPRDHYCTFRRRTLSNKERHLPVSRWFEGWSDSAQRAGENRLLRGDDQYLVSRYEDLVGDAEAEMRRVASFLDIEFVDALRAPTSAGGRRSWGGNPLGAVNTFTGIEQSPAGRWQAELSEEETELIECLLESEMAMHGYTPTTTPSATTRRRALMIRMAKPIRRARFELANRLRPPVRSKD